MFKKRSRRRTNNHKKITLIAISASIIIGITGGLGLNLVQSDAQVGQNRKVSNVSVEVTNNGTSTEEQNLGKPDKKPNHKTNHKPNLKPSKKPGSHGNNHGSNHIVSGGVGHGSGNSSNLSQGSNLGHGQNASSEVGDESDSDINDSGTNANSSLNGDNEDEVPAVKVDNRKQFPQTGESKNRLTTIGIVMLCVLLSALVQTKYKNINVKNQK